MIVLSPFGLEEVVRNEVGARLKEQRDRLFLLKGSEPVHFAQNIWLEPKFKKIESIGSAAKFLKGIQRNWVLLSTGHHRRAQLIQEQLPPLKTKRVEPYSALPIAPLGAWTLWDESTIFYSATTSSPFPNGEIEFIEDKINPPSRAYLKLWETFLLEQRWPTETQRVLDLGSSPGGWTWALDQLGCELISVDKAPLAEKLKLSSRVKFINESAFALEPKEVGAIDWLFSDIICYPEKLLELIHKWRDAGVKNFVCTLKFQGETNFKLLPEFFKIPGGKLKHLFANKHELTFILVHSSPT